MSVSWSFFSVGEAPFHTTPEVSYLPFLTLPHLPYLSLPSSDFTLSKFTHRLWHDLTCIYLALASFRLSPKCLSFAMTAPRATVALRRVMAYWVAPSFNSRPPNPATDGIRDLFISGPDIRQSHYDDVTSLATTRRTARPINHPTPPTQTPRLERDSGSRLREAQSHQVEKWLNLALS